MKSDSVGNGGFAALGTLRRHGARAALSLVVCVLLVWLLMGRLSSIKPAEVALAFASLPAESWLLASLATMISFWAVGHYDAVIHRHFATQLPEPRVRLAGICAIAVSQMIGLGVICGAVLRWRMLPEIGPWPAARLTLAVALSFLGAWAMVTALVLTLLPGAPFKLAAGAMLAGGLALTALSIYAPRLGELRFRWPNALTLGRLFALCVVDTFAAALAFCLLCPPGVDLPFAILLPAFLLALGAGLVSGAPGGMGAFEITLLALLPTQPQPELLAAILAWRIVYFALPAIFGAGLAIHGPRPATAFRTAPDARMVASAVHAESQLLRQGAHHLIGEAEASAWVAGRTSHCLIGFFAPLGSVAQARGGLDLLERQARGEGRLAMIYKAPARQAILARSKGYQVLPLAREAVISLASYDLSSPSRSGLRRKLRRAEAAGVCILGPESFAVRAPDWPALDRIAADWAASHGGERGFSMGRYERRYVAGQRLFIACLNDQPLAFVSFHAGPREWVLDLMRHGEDLPDGTMHLLIQTAIEAAKAGGLPRLSLAAVHEPAFADATALVPRLLAHLGAGAAPGLARFKSSFAPRWERRYLCLPSRAALPLAAYEIAQAIHRPLPLTELALPALSLWPEAENGLPLEDEHGKTA